LPIRQFAAFSTLRNYDKIKSAMPAKKFEILFVEGADEGAYLERAHGDQRVIEQSGKLRAIARLTSVDGSENLARLIP
jgi:transketolase C-terminal domain/subunit